MVVDLLAGDAEDAGADDGAEAEPDQVPPGEASLHVVLALPLAVDQLRGVGGAVQEAVPEARAGLRDRRLVGVQALERRLREEVLLPPSPIAPAGLSSFLLLSWRVFLPPRLHGALSAAKEYTKRFFFFFW